jgi:hypothetical protein
LRLASGESLVLEYADRFPIVKLQALLATWDAHNVFGGPNHIHQIRNKLLANNSNNTAVAAASAGAILKKEEFELTTPLGEPKVEPKAELVAPFPSLHPDDSPKKPLSVSIPAPAATFLNAPKSTPASPYTPGASKEVLYDFEAHGIAATTINDVKELIEPCRAIAT